MSDIDLQDSDPDARMELGALISYVWEGRRIILWTLAAFFVFGLLLYRLSPPVYEATAVLSAAPANSTDASRGGGLSGAARLIGLAGGGDSGAEYTKFQALLTSAILADRMAARKGVLQAMFPNQWDAATHTWKMPSGILASIKGVVRAVLGRPAPHPPDAQSVLVFLQTGVEQDLSLQTSLLDLSVRSRDPALAKLLLTVIHREADNILRDAARTRSQRRIAYLESTLPTVNAVEQRQALIQLLDQEEQTNMMIESDPNFAADLVDPPHVLPNPVSPSLPVFMLAAIFGGLLCGVLLYIALRLFGLHEAKLRWPPVGWVEALPRHHR